MKISAEERDCSETRLTSGGISRTFCSSLLEYIIRHTKEYPGIEGINNLLQTKGKKGKKKKTRQ